ncbi:unnamed protein product [Rotaria sp. Silwood1]|nr:unnamed protein product [Rotaria sp. Silwood1]
MLVSCWAQHRYIPGIWSGPLFYLSDIEEFDRINNPNINNMNENDLLEQFLPVTYKPRRNFRKISRVGIEQRKKKFLSESLNSPDEHNLQGLWAMPGRHVADFDCFERPDTGVGRAYFEVYAWQASNRTCTKFIYGGMFGNRNRFETSEECSLSCHDAVLRHQLDFKATHRYSAVNRLYELAQIALHLEKVDNGYFKLIAQPSEKVLGITNENDGTDIALQQPNNTQTQHWDIIPTGEKDYFRIKTRTMPYRHVDYLFLQVAHTDEIHINLGRRDNDYLGQQWRFV